MDPGGTGLIDAALRLLDGRSLAALAVGFVLSLAVGIVVVRRTGASPVLASLTVFSAVFVAVAMLQMGRAGGGALDRDPLAHFSIGALGRCFPIADGAESLSSNETRLNLLLYVPFGVFATLTFGRPWRALAVSVALILAMEALQAVLDVGVCSALDVVTNLIGVAIAIAVTAVIQWSMRHRRDRTTPGGRR